jgi:hypothetical protein
MASRESRVTFDDLQQSIPRITLELDVAKASETDSSKNAFPHFGSLGQPLRDMKARKAPERRVPPKQTLRESKEIFP